MSEVIIVGGGVIGMLTARELHARGVETRIIERGKLGGESSWAGGGIISPLYPWTYDDAVNRLAERSKRVYPELADQLIEETGLDCELLDSGMLVANVADNVDKWCEKWSISFDKISKRSELAELEPALSSAIEEAYWFPEIRQVRNPRLVKALEASLSVRGVTCLEHTAVDALIVEGGRVRGVRTASGEHYADAVIVASGAWSAKLLDDRVAVSPVKGQMIMYQGAPGVVSCMVLKDGHYIIPRKDGHVLAGSTLERCGFDKTISKTAMEELSAAAIEVVPSLADMKVSRQWAGLRPGTEKGIPYVCAHDEIESLYINAGHYRNGIVLGPATAELVADLVTGAGSQEECRMFAMAAEH